MLAKESSNKWWIQLLLAIISLVVIVAVTRYFVFQAKRIGDRQIAQDISQLSDIFNQINQTCKILEFKNKKESINFLTVKEFSGSLLGSMLLREPNNWQGPYLDENLTIEGREYQIIRAKNGYYILPGDGVSLSNEQIINKTLNINKYTDIENLMKDPKYLLSEGKPLAAYVNMSQNPELIKNDELIAQHIQTLKDIFYTINKECKIIAFRYKKNIIDFLNVKSFMSNIVGPMSIKYRDKWQGPYLDNNLSIRNIFYQIIKTKKGYYILPGDGVQLSNGKIIGKTLVINKCTDIDLLLSDSNDLNINKKPMAAKLDF